MARSSVTGLLVLVLAVLVAGCATTQSAWKSAAQKNTLAGYDDFLVKYGKTTYADSAQMAKERLNFDAASKENTVEAYQRFLAQYPKGAMSDQAQDQIEGIEFQTAAGKHTVAAYSEFLTKYPRSKKADAARAGIVQIKTEMKGQEPVVAAGILQQYPASQTKTGEIPAKYVGSWVYRADDMAAQYLIITPNTIIWKVLQGTDASQKVFKSGNYTVGAKGLKFKANIVYSMDRQAKSEYTIPVPVTVIPSGSGLELATDETKITLKGNPTRDWFEGSAATVKDGTQYTRPAKQLMFVKAGM